MSMIENSLAFVREDSRTIYKNYGRHLSNVSCPGKNDKILMSQSIGDALVVFRDLFKSTKGQGQPTLNYKIGEDKSIVLEFSVPNQYTENGLLPDGVDNCWVEIRNGGVSFGYYSDEGTLLTLIGSKPDRYVKLFRAHFMAFIAQSFCDAMTIPDYAKLAECFVQTESQEDFIKLYCSFYARHIKDSYEVEYKDVKALYPHMKRKHVKQAAPSLNPFTEAQMRFIPNLSVDEFVLAPRLKNISTAVKAGDIITVLLHGPAGTGKTTDCKLIAREIRYPVMAVINCTENLDEFVLGKYIPVGSEIVFKESEVTEAIRNGGIVVFEEINFAKPQYLAFLNSLLDDNGFVRLDNGEIVKRHPSFRFFATMNMGYFGTRELNQALYNRFNCVLEIPGLDQADIKRMLISRVPSCRSYANKMIGVYNKIKTLIDKQEMDAVISPRNLENWARLAKYEGYKVAAETTIMSVAKDDKDFAKNIADIIDSYKWEAPIEINMRG